MIRKLPKSGQIKVLVKNDADLIQVIDTMLDVIELCKDQPVVKTVAKQIGMMSKNSDQVKVYLSEAIYECAYFYPDDDGYQLLRTPTALVNQKRANCVDYSIFLASVLRSLNIPCQLKIVSFKEGDPYTHVYVVSEGTPIDLVQGQNQEGKEIIFREYKKGVTPNFFQEFPYISSQLIQVK